jgi:hypothetical protein
VFPVRREYHLYIEKSSCPRNRPWRSLGVSCEVRTSFTHKKYSYPHNRPWRPEGVSCEAQASSTCKNKSNPITGRGGL